MHYTAHVWIIVSLNIHSSTWRQITPLTFMCLAALVLRDPIPWLIEEVILIPLHCYMGVAIDLLL